MAHAFPTALLHITQRPGGHQVPCRARKPSLTPALTWQVLGQKPPFCLSLAAGPSPPTKIMGVRLCPIVKGSLTLDTLWEGHFSPAKHEPHENLSRAFLGAGCLAEGPLLGRDRPEGLAKVLFLKGCGQQCILTAVILFY